MNDIDAYELAALRWWFGDAIDVETDFSVAENRYYAYSSTLAGSSDGRARTVYATGDTKVDAIVALYRKVTS